MAEPMNEEEALRALREDDPERAALAEAFLWKLWCRSGNREADSLFREGVEAMQRAKLDEAEALFTRVIAVVPEFAEGWNKRATVRYMARNFSGSIADCKETVTRNPNHFGAFSGRGLCHMSLGQYRDAADSFRKALEIHPHLRAVHYNLSLAVSEASRSNGH